MKTKPLMQGGYNMKKRIISMVLAVTMLLGMLPTAVFATDDRESSALPFTDVKPRDWYHDHVSYVWENGLFNGMTDTTFGPKENLTRGMFVTVLGRMAGVAANKYTTRVFQDVDPAGSRCFGLLRSTPYPKPVYA